MSKSEVLVTGGMSPAEMSGLGDGRCWRTVFLGEAVVRRWIYRPRLAPDRAAGMPMIRRGFVTAMMGSGVLSGSTCRTRIVV